MRGHVKDYSSVVAYAAIESKNFEADNLQFVVVGLIVD